MDVLLYLFLAIILIPANLFAIKWHKNEDFHLWISGLLLAIAGVILGFVAGAILVPSSGAGGAIAGAFVGIVIVANGLLYFTIGLAIKIGKSLSKNNTST